MNKVIGIFSAKGGVGKTTTAINLASALTQFGRIVLVVDSDLTSPNLGMYLGSHNIPSSLNSVLKGETHIKDAISVHQSGINIIVGSINPQDVDKIDYNKISEELAKLKGEYEIILVDSAPGHNHDNLKELSIISSMLVVTTPELTAVTDALRTITMGKQLKKEILGIVLARSQNHEHEMSKESVESMLGVPVLAVIPEDKNVPLSAKVSSPATHSHPESPASLAYKGLAAKLLGENYIYASETSKGTFNYMMKHLGLR